VALSLVALDRNGKAVHALARKSLRNGTFTATLGGAATYALRMTVAAHTYSSTITARAPVTSPPAAAAPAVAQCAAATGTTAALSLDLTTVAAGGTLPYHVINTSTGCEQTGEDAYDIERQQPDGTWTSVFPAGRTTTLEAYPLAPGQSAQEQAQVPAGLTAGTYQLTTRVNGANADPVGNPAGGLLVLTAPFTVGP
jgi:hypothetical protein